LRYTQEIDRRLVTSKNQYIMLPSKPGMGTEALRYAKLVEAHQLLPDSHYTPSAEPGRDLLSHLIGKYGELLLQEWFITHHIDPIHAPFRDDYRKKVHEDDFVYNRFLIEAKAKRRGDLSYLPKISWKVNVGVKQLHHDIYIFFEIGRINKNEINPEQITDFANDPPAAFVGWATQKLIRERGIEVVPGTHSDNDNHIFKRYDWDILISNLYQPSLLLPYLQDSWTTIRIPDKAA
jgi:hypothetical protein